MIQNHLRIAIRHFKRNRIVSLINLIGLSIGLASCLVAGLYIKHELSANRFHKDMASIYRVTLKLKQFMLNGTPYPLTEIGQREIPGINDCLRTSDKQASVKINNEIYKHQIILADPNFLTFFTFPLAQGNPEKALSGLKQVVISHEMKQTYFPDTNPMGKTIQIGMDPEYSDFEISGVTKPTPSYSSMYFDFIIPLENKYTKDAALKNNWGMFTVTSFIKIDNRQLPAIKKAMSSFVQKYFPGETEPDGSHSLHCTLHAFADHHLNQGSSGGGLREGNNSQSLLVFVGIAILILLLACFNYMNLTNAQSGRRSVEVGIRKVIGAARGQLARQFLAESLIMSTWAAALALCIAELCLFLFSDLLKVDLSVFDFRHADVYTGFVIITILTGLLGGGYPAFVLTNLKPISTLKRNFRIGGSNWITRLILSTQFGLSIVLVVSAIVMWKQQKFISEKDMGYNAEQVLVVSIPQTVTASVGYLKTEIKKLSMIQGVSHASSHFTEGSNATMHPNKDNQSIFIYVINIDEEFVPTMEMTMVKGRNFDDHDNPATAILVNETFIRAFNLGDSIGVPLQRTIGWTRKPVMVGVIKDFHHSAMKHEIAPLMFLYKVPPQNSYLMMRLAPGHIARGMDQIRETWHAVVPDVPFDFSFQDQQVQRQYQNEERWSIVITIATGMAIFLSMFGLLGLAMFTAEQRKKEIGIRKVLGASVAQLVNLLSKDYFWLITIAFFVLIPVSYYLMSHYWLNNFVYRIEIDVVVYVIALTMVLLITATAIGSQTIRAAMQNPADVLKEE